MEGTLETEFDKFENSFLRRKEFDTDEVLTELSKLHLSAKENKEKSSLILKSMLNTGQYIIAEAIQMQIDLKLNELKSVEWTLSDDLLTYPTATEPFKNNLLGYIKTNLKNANDITIEIRNLLKEQNLETAKGVSVQFEMESIVNKIKNTVRQRISKYRFWFNVIKYISIFLSFWFALWLHHVSKASRELVPVFKYAFILVFVCFVFEKGFEWILERVKMKTYKSVIQKDFSALKNEYLYR